MSLDDRTLRRLLRGRDEPTVFEREEELERVLARIEPRPGSQTARWAVVALAAAAAIAFVRWPTPPASDGFTARGGGAVLSARCSGSTTDDASCPAGATLAIELGAPRDKPFVGLYRRRPDGVVVWYHPAKGAAMPRAADLNAARSAIVLDGSEPAGDHELVAVYASRALTRDEIKRRLDGGTRADDAVDVAHRVLHVRAP